MIPVSDHPPQTVDSKGTASIERVLIVGGTHGNELTGVYLINQFDHSPGCLARSSFKTVTQIGNPRAIAQGTRYVDQDLNRCFNFLAPPLSSRQHYEKERAKDLFDQYGAHGTTPVDFVIDLHSTTSNAGLMLILDHLDSFTLQLAAYLQGKEPEIKLYSSLGSGREHDSMRTLGRYRLGIEVGPIAHGTLQAELFRKTESLIHHVLDYVEHYNGGRRSAPLGESSSTSALTVYQYVGAIDYPKNEQGAITAMVHPQRQFQDYQVVNPGDPMFLTFAGETIGYQGKTPVYPIFINEAAYYEKGVAMSLTQRTNISPGN